MTVKKLVDATGHRRTLGGQAMSGPTPDHASIHPHAAHGLLARSHTRTPALAGVWTFASAPAPIHDCMCLPSLAPSSSVAFALFLILTYYLTRKALQPRNM